MYIELYNKGTQTGNYLIHCTPGMGTASLNTSKRHTPEDTQRNRESGKKKGGWVDGWMDG